MATFRLTNENFEDIVHKHQLIIVDFWAEWCSTCSSFAPIYIQISEKYPDVLFGKVNTQFEQGISAKYRIQSIPTLIGFKNGEEIYRKPGAIPGQTLDKLVVQLKSS